MSRIFGGISLALIAGALVVANPSNVGARPNPREVEATRADKQRAAQLRHARERRDAARRNQPQSARSSSHRRPVAWPALITEARKYIGTNPTAMQRRWCARFLNLVLNKTGYRGTGSDAARSFASYGRRVNEPRIGAIAVLSRGKNQNFGHVGIVTGVDANGNPVIISGNHGRRVAELTYPRGRVIAYVMPSGRAADDADCGGCRRVSLTSGRPERPSGANCGIARGDQFRGVGASCRECACFAPGGAAADRAVGCSNASACA